MSHPFSVTTTVRDDAVVCALQGELDLACEDELRECFASAARLGPRTVVVDLSGVTFLDVVGARALRLGALEAAAAERVLVVAGISPGVRRYVEVTGLDADVTQAPTVRDALRIGRSTLGRLALDGAGRDADEPPLS